MRDYPVLQGVVDGIHTRVWCDGCFIWHWHGGPGMKVPHCAFSPTFYIVSESTVDPDMLYAYRWGRQWRVVCPRPRCNTHLQPTTGTGSRPHHMIVVERPGPGSPSFCTETGRFIDLRTGEVVDPGYSEAEMIRFRYFKSRPSEHERDTAAAS